VDLPSRTSAVVVRVAQFVVHDCQTEEVALGTADIAAHVSEHLVDVDGCRFDAHFKLKSKKLIQKTASGKMRK
jgi:hypothetical protein